MLAEALTPAFVKQPSSANLLTLMFGLKARRGQWQEAAADAALESEHRPSHHTHFPILAALLVKTGNRVAYEQLRKRLLTTFANPTNIYIGDQVAKACLFLPTSAAELKIIRDLADASVTHGIGDQAAMPFFQTCKALSEYLAEAVEWAQKPLQTHSIASHGHAYAVLAMACWKLEKKDEAREMLAKGNTLAPRIVPAQVAEDPENSWLAWLYARIQLDEASALIEPASSENKSTEPE